MEIIVDGLSFAEGPRWHDGKLYFSDFYRHVVNAVTDQGELEVVAEVPEQPSGLGWLPDGRLLIVSMLDRRLLRQEPDGTLVEHANLGGIATWHCNDMVVDAKGRAYVGNFGFDIDPGAAAEMKPADLARVDPDGTVSVAATDLQFPNGTVITPDGRTLIIGETWGRRLTAFDIGADGSLTNRRVWADIEPHLPDGICLDAEGAVWVADPGNQCVIRVKEGGEITDRFDTELGSFACMLGGADGRSLYVCIASGTGSDVSGHIAMQRVDVPHAGLP